MAEVVLKKVCKFLQNQEDQEAMFKTFWEGTKSFYPSGQSKTKLKEWLKGHSESFEIIKRETGDPFGKIKLKGEAPVYDLPDTTWVEDFEITQELIKSIDNEAEHGHLFSIICKNKASIFPEILQDKKQIRKWLMEHERRFKMVKDANGGLYSVEVAEEGRNLSKCEALMSPAMRPNKDRQCKGTTMKGTPQKERHHETTDLLLLAEKIVQRISEKIKNEGMTFPFESLLKEKAIVDPINDATALNDFLAAYPMKFEIIDVEGLGRWVHLKDTNDGGTHVGKGIGNSTDVVSKVASFICENGGTISFVNLLKKAPSLLGQTVNNERTLSAWLGLNAKTFEVLWKPGDHTKPWQVKVKFCFSPRFCLNYVTKGQCQKKDCQFLHICKSYVCQQPHESCKLSHEIRDEHNKMIIDKMGFLSEETDTVVLNVLLKSCFPRVCTDYNKNGNCPRGEACHFLHICGNYVLNQCSACPLNHNIVDCHHNIELLKKYALHPSQKMSEEIVKANIAFAVVKKQQQPSQFAELDVRSLHISCAPGMRDGKIQQHQMVGERVKKRHQRRERRRRVSGQASGNAGDSSSADADSTGGEINHSSTASSCHNSNQPLLSFKNIQKGHLAASLTGNEKVNKWMGSSATESDQVSNEAGKHLGSSSSSEASYASNQSSAFSSQSLIWQDDFQKQVFLVILEKYEGSVPFKIISKDKNLFGPNIADVAKWFQKHPQKFILHRNGQGKIDTVSVFSRKARVCLDYGGKRGCDKPMCGFFHICRDHVEGHCPHGKSCSRNHDISSNEISKAAKHMGFQDLTKRQLFTLIQVSCPSVCHYYNQGNCNRGQFCPNLHVCKAFAKGRRFCKAKFCKYGHEKALQESHAKNILKMYQLWGKQANFKYIRKMIFVFDTKKHGKHGRVDKHHDVQSERGEATETSVCLMDIDLTKTIDNPVQNFEETKGPEEVVPNICVEFLTGYCHVKKCAGIHFGLPYCWQLKIQNKSSSWCNFDETDCINLEKYFCDVNCTAAELDVSTKIERDASSVRVNFEEMSGKIQVSPNANFKIRRLECPKESSFRTKWLWYKLESPKWMQCEDNRASVFEELFNEGKFAINSSSQRRRPLLRNQEERNIPEEQIRTPESPVSTQSHRLTSVPVIESLPLQISNCHRTRVEPSSPDYRDIEELLRSSVGQNSLVINQIEKVVSDDLWEKYKSKKKSMTDELKPGENLNYRNDLFVPCRNEDLERIMKGNIRKSRISLPNQPLDRYYFTSDALFCIQKCRENNIDPRYLIVCQVLLGAYTEGQGLDQFPRRPDGRFYDSLVDRIDNPRVFVIKDVDQCYPAYIIDFSYVTSHIDGGEPMLRGFEVVESHYGLAATPQLNYSQSPPSYDQVPHNTRPTYATQGSSITSVAPQQQPLSQDVPTPNYVKAAPVYPERPAAPAEPPPDYTPPTRPDLPHPDNVRQSPNISQMPVSRAFRDFREKKDNCAMM
ncbi:uncharacterized protein LOC114533627 [Dendronephthya gigantea]|uniref:uncharacterized protein LOC114533627 n=1 Tax=Dendronephthya gigantea TaxID=151771 RepID=UPI001069DDD8|nr:uncharacterized protein LOC114533627 [Dendronephthya gigantea]